MKIRIKDHTIRLRLTKSEVEHVASQGYTSAETHFPGGAKFTYRLSACDNENATANFDKGTIEVSFPKKQIELWATTEQVSLSAQCDTLTLLVEKDFTCLSARLEEQSGDYYPNPLQHS